MLNADHRNRVLNTPDLKINPLSAWIWLAFIAYASFIPFHFRPLDFSDALVSFRHIPLLDLSAGSRADWVANILLYIPLGFLLTGSAAGASRSFFKNCLISAAVFFVCTAAAVCIEFFQVFFSPRTVSLNDLIAEALGSALGIFFWQAAGKELVRTWRHLGRESSPRTRLSALFVFYLIFLLGLSLFPFDFIISIRELHRKLALWKAQPFVETGLVFWIKTLAEGVLFIPVGGFLGLRLKGLSVKKKSGIALVTGLSLSILIEVIQFFMVSGISRGFSVIVKTTGAVVGLWAAEIHIPGYWRIIQPFARTGAILLAPVYLLACLRLSGWGLSGWLGWQKGLMTFKSYMLVPFYYHYFTTESRAVVSILFNFCLYIPLGLGALLLTAHHRETRHRRFILPVLAGVCLSGIIEGGKLFQAGLHPDLTNLLVAAVSVIGTCKTTEYFFPVFRQLHDA